MLKQIRTIISNCKNHLNSIDITLLLFILAITNVSLLIKAIGLVFIYIARFNFNFRLKSNRLPIFYLTIVGLIFIELIINFKQLLDFNYALIVCLCIAFWLGSFLSMHQLKLAIEISGIEKVKKTIEVFFILNFIVSIAILINIMLITKDINPYTYTGMDLNYHMSTGDHITGIFRDLSTTNCCFNIFGVFYFIINKKYLNSILCLLVVLLTTSNINTIILVVFLTILFFNYTNRLLKTLIICIIGIIIVFFIKITPENIRYMASKIGISYEVPGAPQSSFIMLNDGGQLSKRDSLLFKSERDVFDKIYKYNQIQDKKSKNQELALKLAFANQHQLSLNNFLKFSNSIYGTYLRNDSIHMAKTSGKVYSFIETKDYAFKNIRNFIVGSGPCNFSSKLAFKASGIQIFGRYPERYKYINETFKSNHLKILSYYLIQPPAKHSATNMPFSVYNQLIGEYGFLGLLLFICFYIFYFVKRFSKLTAGKFLLPILLLFLITDYWFENLSLVIIFELLMFTELSRKEKNIANA